MWVVAVGAGVFSVLPIVLYQVVIARVPSVTAEEARRSVDSSAAVLVDVRPAEAYRERHVAGSVNWPADEILGMREGDPLPPALQGKRMMLMCESGIMSTFAVRHLCGLGVWETFSVKEGISGYIVSGQTPCPLDMVRGMFEGPQAAPVRHSPLHEQVALVATGFGVKPFYMVLSFVLVVVLWRSRGRDLVALKWGLAVFFLGEAACAANYLVFNETSHLWEYLHSLGMVVGFSFMTYAVLEGMDWRVMRLSDLSARCAATGLCRVCQQRTGGPCGLERVFLWLTAALWIMALMPLTARPHPTSYNTTIFGTVYNYSHSAFYQLYEIMICPAAALICLGACFGVLAFKKTDRVPVAKVLFAAGMGPLLFSFFRMLLLGAYRDNMVWFNFWEEITEGILVVGIAVVLWIFREALFNRPAGQQP